METNEQDERRMFLNLSSELQEENSSAVQEKSSFKKVKGKGKKIATFISNSTQREKASKHQSTHQISSTSVFKPRLNSTTNQRTSSLFASNPEYSSLKIVETNERHEQLFSTKSFKDIDINQYLVTCLETRFNIKKLTEIQEKAIPVLLKNKDALIKSCTGSGKTLTYAIPIVQTLQSVEPKIKRSDGVLALVIVPTRELALQCHECFSLLTKTFSWIVPGYVTGGENAKSEKSRLRKGINILICTPGRLLDHISRTSNLDLSAIKWLVIDEADRLMEAGFLASLRKIQEHCNKERQTVLLSATLSKDVEKLAGMSLTDPVYVDALSGLDGSVLENVSLPAHLKQFVVTVPSKLRLLSLSAFILDKYSDHRFKVLVFLNSLRDVDFHYALLNDVLGSLLQEKGHKGRFYKLHGNMTQTDRMEVFNTFRKKKKGVLFCTDVAARGLDLPRVDWIIQYSAPPSVDLYVHRVGRTARIGKKGSSLLFLLPSENKISELLQDHDIQLNEIHVTSIMQPISNFGDVLVNATRELPVEEYAIALQAKLESTINSENTLKQMAKDAYCSYIQSYASYPKETRALVPFKDLHLGHAAKSYCLQETPSEIGSRFGKYAYKSKKNDKKSRFGNKQKRKFNQVSEFSSGLDELKDTSKKTPKRIKY